MFIKPMVKAILQCFRLQAWDGNGTFSRTNGTQTGATTWANARDAGNNITASQHDTHDQDLAAGINACLAKNGENHPTADFKPNADLSYSLGSAALQWINVYLSSGVRIKASSTNPASNLVNGICEGRLTLSTGVPVPTSDVTAAETLYFTPYKGNRIAVYDGTDWQLRAFSELSIDVPDATNCYDVFVYDNAGTLTLELAAWTDPSNRATALTTQNGVLVKTGALTRRYLGTFYSTTAGNGQIEDSLAKRNLWNYYNRARRPMLVRDTTASWTYTTLAYQQANANTANQLEFVVGVPEDAVRAKASAVVANSGAAGSADIRTGIGLDSTTVDSSTQNGYKLNIAANVKTQLVAFYEGFPAAGRHTMPWLESSDPASTTTWYGTAGIHKTGITGEVLG